MPRVSIFGEQAMKLRTGLLVAAVIGAFGALPAYGAIIDPVGAVANSSLTNRSASNTIDGVGLSAVPTSANILTVKNDEVADEGVATDTMIHGGMWLSNGQPTGVITFDLGSVMTVDKIYVWNYAEVAFADTTPSDNTPRGAQSVDVYSTTSLNSNAVGGGDTFAQSFTLNQAAPSPLGSTNVSGPYNWNADYNTPVGVYTFTTPVTAEFIKLNILTTWGDPSYVGLSEVRFDTVPTPEPSTGLLATLALLGSAVYWNRRRRAGSRSA